MRFEFWARMLVGLDGLTATGRHLPLDGGGWEGVLGATMNIVANRPPPWIPPRKGEGADCNTGC